MSRSSRFVSLVLSALIIVLTVPGVIDAQRRAVPRHPTHREQAVVLRGHVFIGGYFYDPFFGPYPWWRRQAYPYWYYPVYDQRAEVRLTVKPKEAEDAAVYVNGFYAGVVDDFNGVFQALPLTPGGHTIALYLQGYRSVRHNLYLRPGSTFNLRDTMQRLQPGETSELPELAPPVPAPPTGSYRAPVTPSRTQFPAVAIPATVAAGFGILDLFVQPASAEVMIDGQRWVSSDEGHFVVHVPAGKHRLQVTKTGYRQFTGEVEIRDGESSPLNVSLMAGTQ